MKNTWFLVPLCLLAIELHSTEPKQPGSIRTGNFQISSTLAEIVGETSARSAGEVFAPDETISWQVYVPDDYQADKPAGLLVYISPSQSGEIPRGWNRAMDEHNLIWVAANESGNSTATSRRAILAIVAPTLIEKHYKIDRQRLYLSGLSGGGRMASMIATDQAHLFKGAIYNSGADSWGTEPPRRLEQIKQNSYVFITGTLDQALEPTKKAYRKYKNAGVENVKLMVIRDMTHKNPSRFKFAEAIEFLDSQE